MRFESGDTPLHREWESLDDLIGAFAGQIGLGLERARLAEVAKSSRVAGQRESLRNTLLASISHDLRTPAREMSDLISNAWSRSNELGLFAWRCPASRLDPPACFRHPL
jgi:K+-sensing histidine kinase KdpD